MKRIFIMLLIACSTITTISADPTAAPQKKPESVVATLNAIIYKFGKNEGQTYSVNRNPNTGIIESSIKIVPFRCPTNQMQNDNVMNAVATNFPKDEPLSYQFLHIQPGSNENFSLKVITNNGMENKTLRLRSFYDQEMWLMCCKNPDNPQLRDAYAIVWGLTADKLYIEGTVYMITSLRPDVYEKNFESNKRMFKIVGRVDENIKDSLYNIYIADSRDALYNLQDHEYVACVPVINKRFEWQTELDKPCVGRLRCIFPDGELCSAWIDLDFVPGETYNITVHNGYYDEDKDYERRVGRQSGKSLIEPLAVKVVDDVPAEYQAPASQPSNDQPAENVKMRLELIGESIKMSADMLRDTYDVIGQELTGMRDANKLDMLFDNVFKQNKELDKKFQKILNVYQEKKAPLKEQMEMKGGILKFYSEQNKKLSEFYQNYGSYTKSARKLQQYVNAQMEKYMEEIEKSMR